MTQQLLLRSKQPPNRSGMPSRRLWKAGPRNTSSRLRASRAGPSVQRKHRLPQNPA